MGREEPTRITALDRNVTLQLLCAIDLWVGKKAFLKYQLCLRRCGQVQKSAGDDEKDNNIG